MTRRRAGILAAVALAASVLSVQTPAHPLPACPTEDSTGCLWDGRTAGQWHHLSGTLPGQDHRQD
jgi:hypothetical protein